MHWMCIGVALWEMPRGGWGGFIPTMLLHLDNYQGLHWHWLWICKFGLSSCLFVCYKTRADTAMSLWQARQKSWKTLGKGELL